MTDDADVDRTSDDVNRSRRKKFWFDRTPEIFCADKFVCFLNEPRRSTERAQQETMSSPSAAMATAAATTTTTATRRLSSLLVHWMEHHPVVSNSLLCLKLWVAGDVLAQYSEHRHRERQVQEQQTRKNHIRLEDDNNENNNKNPLIRRNSVNIVRSNSKNNTTITDWYDWKRTAKCAGFGALFMGPLLACWYPFLDRLCIHYRLAARYGVWGAPIAKVVADEFVMDPPCIVTFFGYMAAWEHYEQQQSHARQSQLQSFSSQSPTSMVQQPPSTLLSWPEILYSKVQHQFFPTWTWSLIAWPPILLGTFRFLPLYAQAPVINVCCIVYDAFLSYRNSLTSLSDSPLEATTVLDDDDD